MALSLSRSVRKPMETGSMTACLPLSQSDRGPVCGFSHLTAVLTKAFPRWHLAAKLLYHARYRLGNSRSSFSWREDSSQWPVIGAVNRRQRGQPLIQLCQSSALALFNVAMPDGKEWAENHSFPLQFGKRFQVLGRRPYHVVMAGDWRALSEPPPPWVS